MTRIEGRLLDDVCTTADIVTSVAFCYRLRRYRIQAQCESVVTHKLIEFSPFNDVFKCVMLGTDGSVIQFYVEPQTIGQNRQIVDDVVSVTIAELVC